MFALREKSLTFHFQRVGKGGKEKGKSFFSHIGPPGKRRLGKGGGGDTPCFLYIPRLRVKEKKGEKEKRSSTWGEKKKKKSSVSLGSNEISGQGGEKKKKEETP